MKFGSELVESSYPGGSGAILGQEILTSRSSRESGGRAIVGVGPWGVRGFTGSQGARVAENQMKAGALEKETWVSGPSRGTVDGPRAETVLWGGQIQTQWALGRLQAYPIMEIGLWKREGWEWGPWECQSGLWDLDGLTQDIVRGSISLFLSSSVPCSPAHRWCSQARSPSFLGVGAKSGCR